MRISYLLLGCFLFVFSFTKCALATEKEPTIEAQFEAALFCKAEAIDGREPEVVKLLKEQNIEVKNLDEELIELEYHFTKPLQILNVTVPLVSYVGDSGSYFFATAKGDMDMFAKSIGAKPVPADLKEELSWGDINSYYKYAAPATAENPFPKTIIIGRNDDSKPGEFYFGCVTYDY